ncbi:hypothetical protein [Paracoccus benzoatiresistens]|uniref:Uncharacterized protein n=1 Tax=Paracoccus benzoatiresistens TaxID=2997341 RepID=A0ABT4J7D1_9RHOB|nr:hypothetical protein [Paracoccus sp. EF6]MCZ0962351.1 hypothetical protein [Paracoccus sp. EF6]
MADWEYSVALYGWFPDTRVSLDTPLGEVEGELSIGDALDSLDMAFMGAFAAQNGPWSMLADVLYFDLGRTKTRDKLALIREADIDSDITSLNTYVTYQIVDQGSARVARVWGPGSIGPTTT